MALRFRVETVREFSSFGYEVVVRDRSDVASGTYVVEIGGLQVPTNTNPVSGTAMGSIDVPMPADGTYAVEIRRRSTLLATTFTVRSGIPMFDGGDGRTHQTSSVSV